MTGNPLRDLFSRLLWDPNIKKSDYRIAYISRGSTPGYEIISGDSVFKVTKDYLYIRKNGEVKAIPFHRILYVEERGRRIYEKAVV